MMRVHGWLRRIYGRATPWFFWWLGTRHTVEGMQVCLTSPGGGEQELLARAKAALGLIAEYAPVQMEFARTAVRGLLVSPIVTGFGAHYAVHARLVVLHPRFMRPPWTDPCSTACLIVHELMHARLEDRGVTWSSCDRARVERLCYQASLVFAKRARCDKVLISWARGAREEISHVMSPVTRLERWLDDAKYVSQQLGVERLLRRSIVRGERRLAELQRQEARSQSNDLR